MHGSLPGGVPVCISHVSLSELLQVEAGGCADGDYRAGGQYHWVAGTYQSFIDIDLGFIVY